MSGCFLTYRYSFLLFFVISTPTLSAQNIILDSKLLSVDSQLVQIKISSPQPLDFAKIENNQKQLIIDLSHPDFPKEKIPNFWKPIISFTSEESLPAKKIIIKSESTPYLFPLEESTLHTLNFGPLKTVYSFIPQSDPSLYSKGSITIAISEADNSDNKIVLSISYSFIGQESGEMREEPNTPDSSTFDEKTSLPRENIINKGAKPNYSVGDRKNESVVSGSIKDSIKPVEIDEDIDNVITVPIDSNQKTDLPPGHPIEIHDSEPEYEFQSLIPIILFSALVIFILLYIRGRSKKRAGKPEESILAQQVSEPLSEASETQSISEYKEEKAKQDLKPIMPADYKESIGISISPIQMRKGGKNPWTAETLQAAKNYLELDLEKCWQDTAIQKIYIQDTAINDIGKFVRETNESCEEQGTSIPEIGGWLIGNIIEENETQYILNIDQFIPITPDSQNPYTVHFGNEAWEELMEAKNRYDHTILVGWFHTHPGHGLFLSEADIREQKSVFHEPYMVAMELESKTEGFDIAFFTWKRGGGLNNTSERKLSAWWTLKELEEKFTH